MSEKTDIKKSKKVTAKKVKRNKDHFVKGKLTEKQKRFCENYYKDFNGSRAYKEIYKVKIGTVARTNASRLLTNANVKAYLESLKTKLAELSGISPLTILNEYKKIAFSSIANIHNTWIELTDFEELKANNPDILDCIQEIETKKQRVFKTEYDEEKGKNVSIPWDVEYIKVKLYDKPKSLDSINRMLGYDAPTKIDLSNTDGTLNNLSTLSTEELIRRAEALKTIEKAKKQNNPRKSFIFT